MLGWDAPADLEKDPGDGPRPGDDAGAGRAARGDRGAHGPLPRPPLGGAARRSRAAQRVHGWCSPEAIEQVGVRDARDARLPGVGGELLRHARDRRRWGATACTCARTSPARCAAPTSCTRRSARPPAATPTFNVRAFECLGACDIAPMASVDGVYVGPLDARRRAALLEDIRAGRPVLPDKQLARRPVADPRANTREFPSIRPREARRDGRAPPHRRCCCSPTSTSRGWPRCEVYERRGGYESLRKALAMTPEDVLAQLEASGLRGRGGAGFAMGKKVSFLPKGSMDKYLVCNADESEPGTFKDRELMQKTPHMLIEGIVIASYAAGANRSFIYIRGEYVAAGRRARRGARRSARGGLRRRGHPRLGTLAVAGRAPRRRRLHLRRGDRAARLARRQARQPAPEAAVPGQPGPLPGPDADQQRRDARDRAGDHRAWAARSTRSSASRPRPAPSSCRSPATCSAPATTRSSSGIPSREIIYGLAGGPAGGPRRSSAGSPAAPPRRC